jgi:Cu2+-exporting ATPase
MRPVVSAVSLSRKALVIMRQNLWLSTIYNLIAVPIAVLGFVTPLIAAVAMSGSSVIVTVIALRAREGRRTLEAAASKDVASAHRMREALS